MRSLRFFLITLFVTTGSSLAAQEAPVESGARVRVKAPPRQPGWVVGTVVGWESESLVLEPEEPGTSLTFARDQITRLDVHRGRKGRALLGGGIGLLSGVVFSFVLVAQLERDHDRFRNDRVVLGAVFGGGGALLGALVGLLIRTDRWEAVPLERIRVSFTPVRNGRFAILASVTVP